MPTSMRTAQSLLRAASSHRHRCRNYAVSVQSSSVLQLQHHHRSQHQQQRQCTTLLSSSSTTTRRSHIFARLAGWPNNNLHYDTISRSSSTIATTKIEKSDQSTATANKNNIIPKSGDMLSTYAVAVITSNTDDTTDGTTNTSCMSPSPIPKLSTKKLSIQEIIKEIPGTHPRDFFSLSLTSIGDALRKRKAMERHNYSVKNNIHPWFILPRESEILMSFGCVRAIINRKSAFIFDAHKPTIKQQAIRISEQLTRKDTFAFRNGEIIFHNPRRGSGQSSADEKNHKTTQFEIDMVEQIVREVCTMYSRRIRLYEPIVNSLMDRVGEEAFSPSGLHKLAPVKDSLQHFEMNVKGAIHCIAELLSNDEDMLDLLLTEKEIAKSENRTLPMESHEGVERLLEEYARQLNSILLEIDYMLQRVQSKQDMVALSLDAYRNRMIRMNLYLTMGGISLAFGTAVAGFFGMNVINGLEEAEGVFTIIVAGSCLFGGVFLGGCYSYLNGSGMKARMLNNLNQIEVMNRALGDMSALDYSFELMENDNEPLTREKFREKIFASEPEGMRDMDADFLFDLLDYSNNEVIDKDDFKKG